MQKNQKFTDGSIWIVKSSIPIWEFNDIGYIVKVARMQIGTMILVISGCENDKRLIQILTDGLKAFVFYSYLEIYCDRVH